MNEEEKRGQKVTLERARHVPLKNERQNESGAERAERRGSVPVVILLETDLDQVGSMVMSPKRYSFRVLEKCSNMPKIYFI